MQKARSHFDCSKLLPLVSVWFQGLFTPLLRVLLTFPLRYWFAIGLPVVFRLGGWCRRIQTRFHESGATWESTGRIHGFDYAAITLCGRPFQAVLIGPTLKRAGWSDFARHYSRNLG